MEIVVIYSGVYFILGVMTGLFLAYKNYGVWLALFCGLVFPATWIGIALTYLIIKLLDGYSPTTTGGAEVPVVLGQTDDRQAKPPVNTPVNESVNKPPVYEYMTLYTEMGDINYLRRLGAGGWKVIQSSHAVDMNNHATAWLLLMREAR